MSFVRDLFQRVWALPLVVAVFALLVVMLTLDPGESWPRSFEGPGITLDESFNVQMGVYLVKAVSSYGSVLLVDPLAVTDIFGAEEYNPDHPPLGRLWLGVFHELALLVLPETGVNGPFVTLAARTGSAVAYFLTVFVIGLFTSNHYGRLAGFVAAIALVAMPRLFGHAHLAALETVLNLFWALAVLGLAHGWSDRTSPPTLRAAFVTGGLLGCVALTKIQFVVLPPIVMAWAFWHWRAKALRPVAIWALSGLTVFWCGWPWLWLDVPGNVLKFLGRSTDRVQLKCFYLGTVYADVDVPWHYPWVMFLVTLPLGVLVLGGLGVGMSWKQLLTDPKLSLLGATLLGLPLLFSTSVAVYDGERLFLPSFVNWAVFVGIGGSRLFELARAHVRRPQIGLAAWLVGSMAGLFSVGPYWLSYYGGLVGDLRGAAALGFEVDYWGQAFSRSMWSQLRTQVADRTVVGIAPSLHPYHFREVMRQEVVFGERDWSLAPFDVGPTFSNRQVLRFERRADGPTAERLRDAGFVPVVVIQRQGVMIGALWERR